MIRLKTFLVIAAVLMVTHNVTMGQELHTRSNRALRAYNEGKQAYDFINYAEAERNLLIATEKDENFIEAFLLIAELYKDQKRYDKSIKAYERVMQIDSMFFLPAFYSLGEVRFFKGDYKGALSAFRSFIANRGQANLQDKAKKYIDDCIFSLDAIEHPVPFKPVSLGDSINTANDEYWPAITVDNRILMFTRQIVSNTRSLTGRSYQEDFYYSTKTDGRWSVAKSVGAPLNTPLNEGAQTLSAGGQYMYFTACNRDDGRGGCDIYFSAKTMRGWSQGINLGSPVNTPYWESQPSISADGTSLYFVSSRPGGSGGMDIWVSRLKEDGDWSDPENLGEKINTPGDEMSPFIHFDGKTLYFSSNGRPCMGGFDIYMSKMNEDGEWSEPENLGYPINTHTDEIGLIIDASGELAYFSSDILPGRGRDLFYFELPEEYRPEPVSYVHGVVYDKFSGKKLKASYELTDLSSNKIVTKSFTSDDGNFLVCLNPGHNYGLNVDKDKYLFYSEHFRLEGVHSVSEPFEKQIELSPIRVGGQISLFNVFFETDSWFLRDESVIELTKLYELLKSNPGVRIEIGGHTDSSGTEEHNIVLSEKRAGAVRQFLIEKGIAGERMNVTGYGETRPLTDNDTEEGRQRNRRTEIKIISM